MTEADVKIYQSEYRPINDTDPVGGAIGTTEITDLTVGEWFPAFGSNPAGGSARTHLQKLFVKNEHVSHDLLLAKAYVSNLMSNGLPGSIVKLIIPNSTDATNTRATIYGFDSGGVFQTEVIDFAGVITAISGTKVFAGSGVSFGVLAVMLTRTDNGLSKVLANVDLTITDGSDTTIGVIPKGLNSAISFISIGIETIANKNIQATNRLEYTPFPNTATWGTPTSPANALDIPGVTVTGTIEAGATRAIWGRCAVDPGIYNLVDWTIGLEIIGESSV